LFNLKIEYFLGGENEKTLLIIP
ncbi:MAG: hypothetical protein A8274_1156, partial [Halanaerobium sp. 4-GBenrich]